MKDLFRFPLNIQLFAADDNAAAGGNEDTGADENNQGAEGSQEKTFTQAEVNVLIAKEKAKAKGKSQKQTAKTSEASTDDQTSEQSQDNPFIKKYAQAEIKVAMTENGIDPKKVGRAVRLIDVDEVLTEEGEVDTEKLNTSITDLLKDFPELKTVTEDGKKGIKIGSEGNDKKDEQKKPVSFSSAIHKNIAEQMNKAK